VLGNMSYPNYPQKNPADCPIIDINPQNIYEELKNIILDHPRRVELAKKSRPYVEKHLDIRYFCQTVADLLNGKNIDYDYEPTFFRHHFIPESDNVINDYNQYTQLVGQTDWYKKYVPSGKRNELIF
jgi:hypothetical protein